MPKRSTRGITVLEMAWVLLFVAIFTSLGVTRYQNSQVMTRMAEVSRVFRAMVELQQSYFFRPRLGAAGETLPSCLLLAPLSPDDRPGLRPRPWADPSGNFSALGFSWNESTTFSYAFVPDSDNHSGLCAKPDSAPLHVSQEDARISLIALGASDSGGGLSLRPEGFFVSSAWAGELASKKSEKIRCPLADCGGLENFFRLGIRASRLRTFEVTGPHIAIVER